MSCPDRCCYSSCNNGRLVCLRLDSDFTGANRGFLEGGGGGGRGPLEGRSVGYF